jgi:hypothetical protein
MSNATIANGSGPTSIGDYVFNDCTNLISVMIGNGVTIIGQEEFYDCPRLSRVYFTGNAPTRFLGPFIASHATVCYLPGTTGWSYVFWGWPSGPPVLWNPLIQTGDGSFGVQTNQFGFTITNGSTTNIPIVVEACTNLASPVWTPLQTVTLTNGSFYFSDPQWSNYPARFYGLGFP